MKLIAERQEKGTVRVDIPKDALVWYAQAMGEHVDMLIRTATHTDQKGLKSRYEKLKATIEKWNNERNTIEKIIEGMEWPV